MKTIAVLVGSLRNWSWSKKIAHELQRLASEDIDLQMVEIGDVPLYNEDLESVVPAAWTRLRTQIRNADAFLFVTPEYNRSMPGGLKNAIDVASRPREENGRSGKSGAVISVSPSNLGGFGANQSVRQVAAVLNIALMPQPEWFYHQIMTWFDEDGMITASWQEHLTKFLIAYEQWINKS